MQQNSSDRERYYQHKMQHHSSETEQQNKLSCMGFFRKRSTECNGYSRLTFLRLFPCVNVKLIHVDRSDRKMSVLPDWNTGVRENKTEPIAEQLVVLLPPYLWSKRWPGPSHVARNCACMHLTDLQLWVWKSFWKKKKKKKGYFLLKLRAPGRTH